MILLLVFEMPKTRGLTVKIMELLKEQPGQSVKEIAKQMGCEQNFFQDTSMLWKNMVMSGPERLVLLECILAMRVLKR